MAALNRSRQPQQDPFNCEICDKEFRSNYGLNYHVNIVHKLMKEHRCNICQSVFQLQSKLTSHVKIAHENKKHHKCDSCEKSFHKQAI